MVKGYDIWREITGYYSDRSGEWRLHTKPYSREELNALFAAEQPARRLRGSQAEPGHHLGRGTRWVEPRSKT